MVAFMDTVLEDDRTCAGPSLHPAALHRRKKKLGRRNEVPDLALPIGVWSNEGVVRAPRNAIRLLTER
jgi:hypothetical protein